MGSTFNGLVGLIILALDIWAILNVLKSGAETGMKILWVLLIVLLMGVSEQAHIVATHTAQQHAHVHPHDTW